MRADTAKVEGVATKVEGVATCKKPRMSWNPKMMFLEVLRREFLVYVFLQRL